MKTILIVALLATAFATNFAPFEALEKNELGKTLLNTIAIQLSTGEPLERIFQTLYDLEDRYIADQKEDDENNRAFQGVCDADLNGLNAELANLEQRDTELQAVLDDLVPLRDQRNGQKQAKELQRKELQKVIDETNQKRADQNNEFEEKREEFAFVSSVLAEARRLFTDNLQAPSFLQKGANDAVHFTPQVLAQVASHLAQGAHKAGTMKHVKSFGKAVKLLAQLASRTQQQANQELVGKIIHLIDDLQNQMSQAFDLERRAEDDRVRAYNAYSALLTKDMNKYNASIANLAAEIGSLQDRIDATNNSKEDNRQRTEAKTQQRDDRRAECQEAAYDYAERRSARDSNRQTVSDLVGILNSNMRDLKEYIALRIAAGDEHFN